VVEPVGKFRSVGVLVVNRQTGGGLLERVAVGGVGMLALQRVTHGVADGGLEVGQAEREVRRLSVGAERNGLGRGNHRRCQGARDQERERKEPAWQCSVHGSVARVSPMRRAGC
jgi:hypothetical protein